MDELMKQLILKNNEIDEIIKVTEDYLGTAPQGTLHIIKNHNNVQYYVSDLPDQKYRVYISKKNYELIHGLAQKNYAGRLLKLAKEEQKSIQQLLQRYDPKELERLYEELPAERKKLITPYLLPEEEFVKQWMSITYERKSVDVEEDNQILTERGEIVRSKSEKILADKLNMMDIPYHYEKPLYLNGYGFIYPDFTALNKRTRREYYWEHFGLMDQFSYCEKAIMKIETMQRNGIFIGEQLILTFETSRHPLNTRIVESLIEKYLL